MSNEINTTGTQLVEHTWLAQAAAAFAGGNGSETDPYLISNAAQLAFMAKVFNDKGSQRVYSQKYFELTNSINLENIEWTPICDSPFGRKPNISFYFDGANHTIYGLTVSAPEASYRGLFGFVGSDSDIKNLNVAYGNVSGYKSVGGIAGRLIGNIENCTFSGQVKGQTEAGGIVGSMPYGVICDCINNGMVTCDTYGAGIAGSFVGYMQNCCNNGIITGVTCIGGLIGVAKQEGDIESGENSGNVNGNQYIGGIVGQAKDNFSLTLCINHNSINGKNYVGGIAGQAEIVISSSNTGSVAGSQIVGGIGGEVKDIDSCHNNGVVKGSKNLIGGIVGIGQRVRNTINNAEVFGHGPTGGIIGKCEGDLISNCYNTGIITGTGILGGIAGVTTQSNYEISKCANMGKIPDTWASDPFLGRHDQGCKNGAKIESSFYLKGSVDTNE